MVQLSDRTLVQKLPGTGFYPQHYKNKSQNNWMPVVYLGADSKKPWEVRWEVIQGRKGN